MHIETERMIIRDLYRRMPLICTTSSVMMKQWKTANQRTTLKKQRSF